MFLLVRRKSIYIEKLAGDDYGCVYLLSKGYERIKRMKIPPEQIESLVGELAGSDVIPLVQILRKSKNISEFKLAERMKLGINQVRNMLYRMNEHNLVFSSRKKDKKKGWYIYYWTFSDQEATLLLEAHKRRKLAELTRQLDVESQEHHYICKAHSKIALRVDAATALEYDFHCPECNELLEVQDKDKIVKALQKDVERVKLEMQELERIAAEEAARIEAATKRAAEKAKKDAEKKEAEKKAMKKAVAAQKKADKKAAKASAKPMVKAPVKVPAKVAPQKQAPVKQVPKTKVVPAKVAPKPKVLPPNKKK